VLPKLNPAALPVAPAARVAPAKPASPAAPPAAGAALPSSASARGNFIEISWWLIPVALIGGTGWGLLRFIDGRRK
jgi:hypothetical protein